MDGFAFELADVLIYDPVGSNRNATRATLHALGFRNVDVAPSMEALTHVLSVQSLDLLVCGVVGSRR